MSNVVLEPTESKRKNTIPVELEPTGNQSKTEVEERPKESPEKASDSVIQRRVNIFLQVFLRTTTIIFMIILLEWIFQAEGGMGLTEDTVFGLHAFFMALYTVVFIQESILSYSTMELLKHDFNRTALRVYHMIFQILGLVCVIVGITTITYYKSWSTTPIVYPFYTMYSPHSWLGVALITLWGLQFLFGLTSWFDAVKRKMATYKKYHIFVGKVVYVLALATCAMGLQDMQSSDLSSSLSPFVYNQTAVNLDDMNVTGYFPNSNLAQYASSGCILLLIMGINTFLIFLG